MDTSINNKPDVVLNIAQLFSITSSLGIGNRFALWLQGCPFNCKGCVSPNWIPFKKAHIVPIEKLANLIIQQEGITGITISGGEPMMQAGRLAQLLELITFQRKDLDVIIFTGFTLKQLVWEEAAALLNHIDLLVDGQYIESLNENKGLRGSSNQDFHFLTNKLLPFKDEILDYQRNLEFHVSDDGVLMTGIPPADFKW